MTNTGNVTLDPYVEKNRGYMTSSKLKLFMKDPFAYYLAYEKECLPSLTTGALDMGTYFDDFVNLGGREGWEKKYIILEPRAKRTGYKGNKIPITNADGKILLLAFEELERQPLFDLYGKYEKQKELKAEYTAKNGLKIKIRCTLDRYGVFEPKGYEDHALFGKVMIRDTKFIESVDKVMFKIQDYDYIFSMSFYNTVDFVNTGESKPTTLDFVDKTKDNKTYCMIIEQQTIEKERHTIIAALEKYAECKASDTWPLYTQLNPYPDAHIKAERYRYNPAAIQRDFISYQ